MAKLIPEALVPAAPRLKPAIRSRPVSVATNCRDPLPEVICCCDKALASSHPSHPLVFRSELPVTVTFAGLVQITFCTVPLPDPPPPDPPAVPVVVNVKSPDTARLPAAFRDFTRK